MSLAESGFELLELLLAEDGTVSSLALLRLLVLLVLQHVTGCARGRSHRSVEVRRGLRDDGSAQVVACVLGVVKEAVRGDVLQQLLLVLLIVVSESLQTRRC